MKKLVEIPFLPCITMEDLLAFDSKRSETQTCSPIVNAVMTCFEKNGMISCAKVAKCLGVNPVKLGNAVQLMTGMTLNDVRIGLITERIKRCCAEHPDWSSEKTAHYVGFSSRSALWRFCQTCGLDDLYAEFDKN